MAAELAEVLSDLEIGDLQRDFRLVEKKTGESSRADHLRAWISERSSAKPIVLDLCQILARRDVTKLLRVAKLDREAALLPKHADDDENEAMLHFWLDQRGLSRLPEIFDSAWCIRCLGKIKSELFRTQRNTADLNSYGNKCRLLVERCLKIFLGYTWGLLANKSPESFKYLQGEADKKQREHQRFLNDVKEPERLVYLLTTAQHGGRSESMLIARLIQVLAWTMEAVDHHGGNEVINSFISDSWAIRKDQLTHFKEVNKNVNYLSHDQNAPRSKPPTEEDFYDQLKDVHDTFLQWEKNRMLPRVVQQSFLPVETDRVVRVVERSEPVETIAEASGDRTIALVYKDQDPPEGVGNLTFLYCTQREGRIEEFFTLPVPEGAMETSPINLPQEED
jgi:hypothetical protein